jgi:RNA polymerase sigma factor (sigma-70 family)
MATGTMIAMHEWRRARGVTPERMGRQQFATTRWTLVLSAGGRSAASSAALAELCEAYWYPAYAYVRRSGYSAADAADLTQAFFARVLEKQFLKDARPERGRFRSFLLASLKHFILNDRDWHRAWKRGGTVVHVPLDFTLGEDRYQREPSDDLTPEYIYERRWTFDVLDRAMARLAAEYVASGRQELFAALRSHIGGDGRESYAELSAATGISEGALRVAVHRLKKAYRGALRATIAETVDRGDEVDDEVMYLLRVLSRK